VTPRRLLAWTISLAIGAEIFSGNWELMGLPPLDRLLFLAAGAVVLWYGGRASFTGTLRARPIHAVLLCTATYAIVSSIGAGTLSDSRARFALLDRLGLLPFVMFVLAPLVFGEARNRDILLKTLMCVGTFLGAIAIFEGLGLDQYVFPRYIRDVAAVDLSGRAGGPFTESGANGLAMFMCLVAAAVGLATWKSARLRIWCYAVIVICLAGIVFTLTRAVWIAAASSAVAGLAFMPRTRKLILPIAVATAVAVAAMLTFIPDLQFEASNRVADQQPIWDRLNTNRAAIEMVKARPLFGSGWQTFRQEGPSYMWQADTYPLSGAGLEVHNVFLSHAAELGLLGGLLWLAALLGAVGGAILRRGPPELLAWRAGLLAVFIAFVVSANLNPLSTAFPNLLLWTWAGVVAREHFLVARLEPAPQSNGFAGVHDSTRSLA
jgi:putative inorganic carbon (hco3(-)) transporter